MDYTNPGELAAVVDLFEQLPAPAQEAIIEMIKRLLPEQ